MATTNKKDEVKRQSVAPPKGEALDAITNAASKKVKSVAQPTKPQADQALNPDLTSQNDI